MGIFDKLKKAFEPTELTTKQSMTMVRNMVKHGSKPLTNRDFQTGKLIMFKYDAKSKTDIYDKTPLIMVLSQSSTHVMAINFHWAPVAKRMNIIKFILAANKTNIKNGKPLDMDWSTLKPAVKSAGLPPVIRLYIKKRISKKGVVIPDNMILQAAKLKTETFTGGKKNTLTLWQKAKLKAKAKLRKLSR